MANVNKNFDGAADSPSAGLGIGDIYFVLFRHKSKILFFTLVGVAAAVGLYIYNIPVYVSEAKLLVRYVLETKSVEGARSDQQIQSASWGSEGIINSEIEILTSLDLAERVAVAVGPEKIIGNAVLVKELNSNAMAAGIISKGLTVEALKKSSVIRIIFQHSNPEVVQPVVQQLIKSYLQRHAEIHKPLGDADDLLVKQADQLRFRLVETEEELRKLKAKAGVISVEDAKKAYAEQISKIQLEIFSTEAEVAEQQVVALESGVRTPGTNQSVAAEPGVSIEKLNEYRVTLARLEMLRNKEFDLGSQYTEANPLVKAVRQQLVESEAQKKKLELETPKLENYSLPPAATASPLAGFSGGFPEVRNRVNQLGAKLTTFKGQLEKVRKDIESLDAMETQISQLQIKKELETKNYRYLASGVEQARFDEALGSRQISNIIPIQSESPPSRLAGERFKLVVMALAGGGLAVGIGLAFILEVFLDRTVKRTVDVETKLRLPLFFSIPRLPAGWAKPKRRLIGGAAGEPQPSSENQAEVPAPFADSMRPMMEDLRDRTLSHFEGNSKKPKLVGVTGCSIGAGVSTIATGLAATLSEAGGGNVLLVDMNMGHGVAHPFFNGKSACAITDAVEGEKRKSGLVSENLYLARAARGKDLESNSLPKRLSEMMPKLKASDFDFIIFDLPPITRGGSSLRMAGMMDLSLLVIEAEKDEQGIVTTASALLAESRANVSVVLNKVRTYVPTWLHREM